MTIGFMMVFFVLFVIKYEENKDLKKTLDIRNRYISNLLEKYDELKKRI